jgi:hypothetical protein
VQLVGQGQEDAEVAELDRLHIVKKIYTVGFCEWVETVLLGAAS